MIIRLIFFDFIVCTLGERRFYLLTEQKKLNIGSGHVIRCSTDGNVRFEDSNPIHGVFVNDGIEKNRPIPKNTPIELQVGHILRFETLNDTFRLEDVDVIVCRSNLPYVQIESLKKQLDIIDGVVLNTWDDSCTHLVMPSITVNIESFK